MTASPWRSSRAAIYETAASTGSSTFSSSPSATGRLPRCASTSTRTTRSTSGCGPESAHVPRRRAGTGAKPTAPSGALLLVAKGELVFHDLDVGGAAVLELAEEQRLRERLFDRLIDQPRHRTGAERDVVAVLGEPLHRLGGEVEHHPLLFELLAQQADFLVHHLENDLGGQPGEGDPGVEAVSEFGGEGPLDHPLRLGPIVYRQQVAKAQHLLAHLLSPGVGGEDQDHVPEIRLPAVVVGEGCVVHHLKEDV